jgi:hypothetical protein
MIERGYDIMRQKVWRNKLEFFPYLSILCFWFFGSFLQSLTLSSRTTIMMLGLVTILPVGLVTIAMVKTYKTLPETGALLGPGEKAAAQSE